MSQFYLPNITNNTYPRSILITPNTEHSVLLGYDYAALGIRFKTFLKECSAFTVNDLDFR